MSVMNNEYISLLKTEEELSAIMRRYEEVGLPGAMGSLDVVHVKRSLALKTTNT
jgi:hypothetical protein